MTVVGEGGYAVVLRWYPFRVICSGVGVGACDFERELMLWTVMRMEIVELVRLQKERNEATGRYASSRERHTKTRRRKEIEKKHAITRDKSTTENIRELKRNIYVIEERIGS